MVLSQLSEVEKRTTMKRLFEYVYFRALGKAGTITHRHDSTLEQACRFLWHFDPEGRTDTGYTAKKELSEIRRFIDVSDLASLPCIEVFLDTALCMNTHFHGIGAKALYEPMTFDPMLQPTLQAIGLLDKKGEASDELLIDAIDRWYFFDDFNRALTHEAKEFLDRVGEAAWRDASNKDKEILLNGVKSDPEPFGRLDYWFTSRWRLGAWLNDGEWERDHDLFGSHPAIGWFMVTSIKKGLDEGRMQFR